MKDLMPTYNAIKPRPGQRLEIGESEKKFWTVEDKIVYTRKICALYATGKYTWATCCNHYGIKQSRFRSWILPQADIEQMLLDGIPLPPTFVMACRELYIDAKEKYAYNYKERLVDAVHRGILKKVEGYETSETTVEQEVDTRKVLGNGEDNPNYGQLTTIKQKVKTYSVAPDTSMLIFAATNVDPTNFKHRNTIEHQGKVDIGANSLESLSDTQLQQKRRELELRLATVDLAKKSA